MTLATDFGAWEERACSPAHGGAARNPVARATSVESHISSVGRSVVEEAFMAARVHEHDLEVRESKTARGSFSGDN